MRYTNDLNLFGNEEIQNDLMLSDSDNESLPTGNEEIQNDLMLSDNDNDNESLPTVDYDIYISPVEPENDLNLLGNDELPTDAEEMDIDPAGSENGLNPLGNDGLPTPRKILDINPVGPENDLNPLENDHVPMSVEETEFNDTPGLAERSSLALSGNMYGLMPMPQSSSEKDADLEEQNDSTQTFN